MNTDPIIGIKTHTPSPPRLRTEISNVQ